MQCRTCGAESGHIKTLRGKDHCHSCGGFRESGGKTDGILTRSSLRVRQDAVLYEGDTIHPYEFDKNRNKIVPSKEFVKKFPDKADEYFTNEQMLDAGHTKLPEYLAKRKEKINRTIDKELSNVQSFGDQATRQKEVLA